MSTVGLADADTEVFGEPPRDLPRWQPPELEPRADVRVELVELAQARARARFLDVADAVLSDDPNFISALSALEIQAMICSPTGST